MSSRIFLNHDFIHDSKKQNHFCKHCHKIENVLASNMQISLKWTSSVKKCPPLYGDPFQLILFQPTVYCSTDNCLSYRELFALYHVGACRSYQKVRFEEFIVKYRNTDQLLGNFSSPAGDKIS